MSCQAKVEILSHFAAPATGPQPAYLKATENGGTTASSIIKSGNIGVMGVKILTSSQLLQETAPWTPLLGGAQFDHPVSASAQLRTKEGCVNGGSAPPCDLAEEGAFNVLNAFFNCTPGAYGDTFATPCPSGPLTGSSPIQYINVDYRDIQYAQSPEHACPALPFPVPSNMSSWNTSSCWSMQDLLGQANFDLFEMAGQTRALTEPIFTCFHMPEIPTTSQTKNICVPQ